MLAYILHFSDRSSNADVLLPGQNKLTLETLTYPNWRQKARNLHYNSIIFQQ